MLQLGFCITPKVPAENDPNNAHEVYVLKPLAVLKCANKYSSKIKYIFIIVVVYVSTWICLNARWTNNELLIVNVIEMNIVCFFLKWPTFILPLFTYSYADKNTCTISGVVPR